MTCRSQKLNIPKSNLYFCMKKFNSRSVVKLKFNSVVKFFFFNILCTLELRMIYMHLLTWVDFGLIGYVVHMYQRRCIYEYV
jgi:hypothetical protein